jgi:hypothetical protein
MTIEQVLMFVISGFSITKACKVSPDEESKKAGVSKTVFLRFTLNGVTVRGILDKAINSAVIAWQTKGRKQYTELKDGSTIEVNFSAPGRSTVNAKEAFTSEFASATPARQLELIEELKELAKANGTKTLVEEVA